LKAKEIYILSYRKNGLGNNKALFIYTAKEIKFSYASLVHSLCLLAVVGQFHTRNKVFKLVASKNRP